MDSRTHLRNGKTSPRGEEDGGSLSYGEPRIHLRKRHVSAVHKADSHERIPSLAQTVPTRGPLKARGFPEVTMLPSKATFVHGLTSPKAAPSTISEAPSASTDALLQVAWLRSSTSRSVGYTRAEPATSDAPASAPSPVTVTRATQIVGSPSSLQRTETKHHPLTTGHSPCEQNRFCRVPYGAVLVVIWLALKNCEESVYNGARRTCLSSVTEYFSPGAKSPTWWPQAPQGYGSVGGGRRYGRRAVEVRSTLLVLSARWWKKYAAEAAPSRAVVTAASGPFPIAGTPVISATVPLAIATFFPAVGSGRPRFVVTACVPVFVSVAASLLLDARGGDVPMPAGRAVIGRPKGGGAAGGAATLGAAGTERTAAAPSAAAPAVNEAGGAVGWREKRGDAAKSGGHNDVMVARGAGAATAAAVAAAATSMTTQEEGFAREGHWARSLRRRWGEQAYLDMVARTINGLESEHFWLAMLGKQLQLQSSKMHLKTQRIERHKLEQRRKKQAMAAFNQAKGKAEAAAAEYQRHQRRGGGGGAGGGGAGVSNFFRPGGPAGAGPGPRVVTAGQGAGAKNEAELRFGELSLYTLDWVGPRTCAQLGWAAGNDVCALSLEIEIHVLHSRLLLKSVEVQDRQNRLFVCDSGAAFFRASAAALAKQEGPPGSRSSKKCKGCDRGGGRSTAGSTTSTTVRGRDKSRETKGGTARSPHTATTGVASVGAIPDAPLAFWDDQGGYGDDWTHGGGSRVGATGAAGIGGSKERGTTGVGADRRRGNRPPAGGGVGAGGAPTTASSLSPARPQAPAGEKAGKKGQPQPHHGGGADGEMKHQYHHVFTSAGEDGSAANGERGTGGTTKRRRRPNRRKKKISSHNKNVAASLGTLHETFDWEAIAHNFYIPALADLQPPGRSMVENFTTELAYLMGVLDREESLRSGKPTVIASSLPHDQLRSPFVYSSMTLTGQAHGADRARADIYPGINLFPAAGGAQVRRPSAFDRKRPAAGGVAWAVESWPGGKGVASMQGALGAAAPAAPPGGTAFHGSTAGNRPHAANVPPFNPTMGRMTDPAIKRRPGATHAEKAGEKGREVAESLKDRNLFPLVRVTSPSRPFQRLSGPSLHGAGHAVEDQQQPPQTYPWRPAVPRSTKPQQVTTRPEQVKMLPAPVLPIQQPPAKQQQDAPEEGDGRLNKHHAYGAVREGERAPTALPEANENNSVLVRNQNWWSQVAAGARRDEGIRQANSRVEPEAQV